LAAKVLDKWRFGAGGLRRCLYPSEILTVKSDDVVGRVKTFEAIVKGRNVPKPGIPESFKVLHQELHSLSLDVRVLDRDNNELILNRILMMTIPQACCRPTPKCLQAMSKSKRALTAGYEIENPDVRILLTIT
jgi:DNA-directed RNA polymerase subunit beta